MGCFGVVGLFFVLFVFFGGGGGGLGFFFFFLINNLYCYLVLIATFSLIRAEVNCHYFNLTNTR